MALKYLIVFSMVCLANSALVNMNDTEEHPNLHKRDVNPHSGFVDGAQDYQEAQRTDILEESRSHKKEDKDKSEKMMDHLKAGILMAKHALSSLLGIISTVVSVKMMVIAFISLIIEKGHLLLHLKHLKYGGAGHYKGAQHDHHYADWGHGGTPW